VSAHAPGTAPLVRMSGIAKAFVSVQALDGVDFELLPGEIHGLAGENGSGKSTLMKILYGTMQADAGTIEIDGETATFATPRQAIERGIVAISQELTLAPTLTVAENILMGRLPRRHGSIDWPTAHRLATEALVDLGVHADSHARVGTLSIEMQQEVEVARAVSADSRVLVLDEATSSLSEAATQRLLQRLEKLRERGVAIVFISHRLREMYQCCSRVTVLRDGRLIGTRPLPATDEHTLVGMMVGREITDLFGKRAIEQGEPVLEVKGLTTRDETVVDASFEVRAGEIVGVAGLVGCGKSELALALGGVVPSDGEIRVESRVVAMRSPRAAMDAGVGFIPEDRKRSAIFPTRSVLHNLSAAWAARLSRLGVIHVADERRLANESVARFGVKTPSLAASIVQLSGGNQQKVVLGRCFALAPRVVVLSEPTRGIDVGAKSEVYQIVQDMAQAGTGVLMVSSEMPELLGLCDRILVMFRGRIEAEFSAGDATEEAIAAIALGHGVGVAVA
jgi:ABC-type sugar transport system ATPase subunit